MISTLIELDEEETLRAILTYAILKGKADNGKKYHVEVKISNGVVSSVIGPSRGDDKYGYQNLEIKT